MRIHSIRLQNYKVFKEILLEDLPPLCVFVGANGSGKSTLFDVFGFLKDALTENVRIAVQRRGGFKEVRTREATGNVQIELKFYLTIAGKERLVTYLLEFGQENGRIVILREVLRYKRARFGAPFHFLDFSRGNGWAVVNEDDFAKADEELEREDQTLGSADILAIKGLGQFERFKAASEFRKFIENWHVSDFHISEARPSRDAGYAEHLSPTGDNISLVAQYMFEQHSQRFEQVLNKMKARVPGVSHVEAATTEDGRVILKFQDGSFKDPFVARYVSDGTIKMFAYLLLLHDPYPHPILCIEEPENQLYPSLLPELIEEFRDYAHSEQEGQVFVSTHSPDLLNATELREVFWLVKENGVTQIKRASENVQIAALVAEGEQLGYLWKQEYFGGSHP